MIAFTMTVGIGTMLKKDTKTPLAATAGVSLLLKSPYFMRFSSQ